MSWIETVDDGSWDGELALLRDRVVDPQTGRVDHIMTVHSLNPRSLAAHDELYRSAMRGTATLRRIDREMIALVVSTINECHY
ncbi:MAG: peroxidase [Acidimicrobiia bacterium]|nr:peroxidase [Acidimicrobiia bacterium]